MITRKHRMTFEERWRYGRLCSFTATAAAIAGSATSTAAAGAGLSAVTAGVAPVAGGLTNAVAASSIFSFSNVLSFASGVSQLAGGFLQGQQLDAQAELEGLRAENELINGRRDIVNEKEALLRSLASFNAQQAGRGVSTVTGSTAAAKRAAVEESEFQTDITRRAARIRAFTRRASAANIASQASGARLSGLAGAIATGAKAVDRQQRRG